MDNQNSKLEEIINKYEPSAICKEKIKKDKVKKLVRGTVQYLKDEDLIKTDNKNSQKTETKYPYSVYIGIVRAIRNGVLGRMNEKDRKYCELCVIDDTIERIIQKGLINEEKIFPYESKEKTLKEIPSVEKIKEYLHQILPEQKTTIDKVITFFEKDKGYILNKEEEPKEENVTKEYALNYFISTTFINEKFNDLFEGEGKIEDKLKSINAVYLTIKAMQESGLLDNTKITKEEKIKEKMKEEIKKKFDEIYSKSLGKYNWISWE